MKSKILLKAAVRISAKGTARTVMKKVWCTALVLLLTLTVACGVQQQTSVGRAADTYTLEQYVSVSPDNWNVHTWESAGDAFVLSFTEMGFVEATMAEDGYEWSYEMAEDITDVTASASPEERAKWNVTEQSGRIFKISLNKNAEWEDGEPITADTYIYSMQQLLSGDMKNPRSDAYRSGENAIYNADSWYRQDVSEGGATGIEWSDVGFYKTDEHTLIYVTAAPQSMFGMLLHLQSNFIVRKELYEENKTQRSGLTVTRYGTDPKSYMSYGPYRLVGFEKDKQLRFERNPKWYGWSDGKHEGQYPATNINVSVITSRETAMQMFLKGELDTVELTSNDLMTYGASEYLLRTPQTYSMRFSFNTDIEALQRIERERADGNNVSILSLTDFRRALSFSFDRGSWCKEVTAGEQAQLALLNELYYYDIENDADSVYRKTEQAMRGITDFYGIRYGDGQRYATVEEAYDSISGYDVGKARELFDKAYFEAVEKGIYTDGQRIVIHIGASSGPENAELAKQEKRFNQFLQNASRGTKLDGLISVKYVYDLSDRYGDTASGVREGCYGGLGGAAFHPYGALNSYIDASKAVGGRIIEGNFNSRDIYVDITCDFDSDGIAETERDSLYGWNAALDGELFNAGHDVKLTVLAKIEQTVLEQAHCFPVSVVSQVELISKKISYAAKEYNIMYGYGGIRHMRFNYSDKQWNEYVASRGGVLNYR